MISIVCEPLHRLILNLKGQDRQWRERKPNRQACVVTSMPLDAHLNENPDHWRKRAEEARRRSEQTQDSITKALLLEIAGTYERLAKAYEKQPSTFPPHDR